MKELKRSPRSAPFQLRFSSVSVPFGHLHVLAMRLTGLRLMAAGRSLHRVQAEIELSALVRHRLCICAPTALAAQTHRLCLAVLPGGHLTGLPDGRRPGGECTTQSVQQTWTASNTTALITSGSCQSGGPPHSGHGRRALLRPAAEPGAGPHNIDYIPTRWPEPPRVVMQCAP